MVVIALGGLAEQPEGRGRLFWNSKFKIQNSKLSPSKLEGVLRSSGGVCFIKSRKGKEGQEREFREVKEVWDRKSLCTP